MFDATAISVLSIPVINDAADTGVFQRCGSINKGHGVAEIVFLA